MSQNDFQSNSVFFCRGRGENKVIWIQSKDGYFVTKLSLVSKEFFQSVDG